MSRKRRSSGLRIQPPHVSLMWDILNSEAYQKMPNSAGKALPYFIGKVKMSIKDPRYYETTFSLSYSELRRYGFSKTTSARIVRYLVKYGFLDPVAKGGLRGNGKSSNQFRLSRRWERYGKADFEELHWEQFFLQKAAS